VKYSIRNIYTLYIFDNSSSRVKDDDGGEKRRQQSQIARVAKVFLFIWVRKWLILGISICKQKQFLLLLDGMKERRFVIVFFLHPTFSHQFLSSSNMGIEKKYRYRQDLFIQK